MFKFQTEGYECGFPAQYTKKPLNTIYLERDLFRNLFGRTIL